MPAPPSPARIGKMDFVVMIRIYGFDTEEIGWINL
jgi:hypothetical protein